MHVRGPDTGVRVADVLRWGGWGVEGVTEVTEMTEYPID